MTFRILDLAARLLLMLGVGCLLLAGYLSWQSLAFEPDTHRTTGEVVSYREVRDDGDTRFRPRIRFKTAAGEIITIDSQFSTKTRRFSIGDRVPMIYKAQQPTTARVNAFIDNWLGACIAAVIGLVGIAGGYLVRRAVRREFAKPR